MSLYKQALELGFITIDFLAYGFYKGWINRKDLVAQAIKDLGTEKEIGDLSVIAFSDDLDDLDFRIALDEYFGNAGLEQGEEAKERQKDKWRLLMLNELDKSELGEEDKTKRLQELYAQFDYPEDMLGCSIYSNIKGDPLVAMTELLDRLKRTYDLV